MSTPSLIMRTATIHGSSLCANFAITPDAFGSSDKRDTRADLVIALEDLDDRSRVLLVDGDHEPTRVGMGSADVDEPFMGLCEYGR